MTGTGPAPHSRVRRRRVAPSSVLVGILTLICLVVCVRSVVDDVKPRTWGTFRQQTTTCQGAGSRWCRSTGEWRSDDGRLTLSDAQIVGESIPNEAVRASYTPGSTEASEHIVRPEITTEHRIVILAVVSLIAGLLLLARRWRRRRSRTTVSRHDPGLAHRSH